MFGSPVLAASNPVFHAVGQIFQPVLRVVGDVLALIYGLIPNYAIAIAILTIIIMLLLTPLTVKSTKSMIAMQRMQPEIKKLQAKYKGPENRQKLNEELMKVYKEQGINPIGGCLPMFLQMPFLYILYDVIRGLTAVTKSGAVSPRYIPKPANIHAANLPLIDRMYHNLVVSGGQLKSFGINLALKPFSHHTPAASAIPFFVFVVVAVGLQYVQMTQMTRRNPGAQQANKQMQTMQKVMPIVFGYIYFLIPAAVVIYMIISTVIRIATQDIMFRTGVVTPANAERAIGGAKASSAPAGAAGLVAGGPPDAEAKPPTKANAPARTPRPGVAGGAQSNGNGRVPRPNSTRNQGASNGKAGGAGGSKDAEPEKTQHPRSKNKRDRRTR